MKLKVTMHTGETYEIPVDNIDMVELNEQRNNDQLNGILVGNHSLSRINIRDIVPMEEEVEEEPEEVEEPVVEPEAPGEEPSEPEEPAEPSEPEETPVEPIEEPPENISSENN